jgi:hypothetical protein
MASILQAMIEDFESRCGDGSDINAYSLGTSGTNKGQPCGYSEAQVICYTLDARMVDLPQVDEDQEDAVWNVLELRCKDLILVDKEERMSDKDVGQESLPHGSQGSQTSPSSHHLACKKASKKVPAPQKAPVSSEVALDALELVKKVSPN